MACGRKKAAELTLQLLRDWEQCRSEQQKRYKNAVFEVTAGNRFLITHFGTRILDFNLESGLFRVGGYSNTDQTIINTALSTLGEDTRVTRRGGQGIRIDDRTGHYEPIARSVPVIPTKPCLEQTKEYLKDCEGYT